MTESVATVRITVVAPCNYNCTCENTDGSARNIATLGALRRRMMVRLGHAATADRPPPGMTDLLNDFLQEAQRFLYEKVASFRQSRFFEWDLQEGVRFYDFHENADGCHRKFVPELVEGVYVTHIPCPHERWQELHAGIDPGLYNGGIRNSWPQRYEFRQCIEIFPAPDARGGYLRIKAKADLEPFTEDEHFTTIDSDLVFMLAMANAKAHYNKPDAQVYGGMVQSRIGDLIAGSHHTRRYIPGGGPLPNANPPVPKDGWDI